MKKLIITTIAIITLFTTHTYARDIKLKANAPDGKVCKEVRFNTTTNTWRCYIDGISKGIIPAPTESTNYFDSTGKEIWENDKLKTVDMADGVVTFGNSGSYIGWYIKTPNRSFWFSDLTGLAKNLLSTIIK